MESYYKRTKEIDQKIHSVKLPYLVWKVLFLIDEKQSLANLKDLLGEKEAVLQDALNILITEGLITEVTEKEKPGAKEEKKEITEEKLTEAQEEEPSEVLEPEEETFSEILEEEIVEETISEKEEVPQEEKETPETTEEKAETLEEEEPLKEDEKEAVSPDFFAEEEPEMVIGKKEHEEKKDEQAEPSEKEPVTKENITEEDSFFDLQEELEEKSVFESVEVEEETKEEEPEIELPQEEKTEEQSIGLDIDISEEKEKEKPSVKEAAPDKTAVPKEGEDIILVIDDSIVIRKMVELALENEDYQIETAVTGKDGLKLLDQLQPNLVILDLMLPDINGIDLLKTIKVSKGIPVIMLSGKDSPQMIEKARAEGADAFLPKPFRDEELVQTIKNLIKK